MGFIIQTRKGIYNKSNASNTPIEFYEIPHLFYTRIIHTQCLRTPTRY